MELDISPKPSFSHRSQSGSENVLRIRSDDSEFDDDDRNYDEEETSSEIEEKLCGKDDPDNILELLPADPFGMDIKSAFMEGLLQDVDDIATELHAEDRLGADSFPDMNLVLDDCSSNSDFVPESFGEHVGFSGSDQGVEVSLDLVEDVCPDAPHDALFFVLGYLGVKDLFSVERVCKSMRDAVKSDPLLWRSILIDDYHLSKTITDDTLMELTSRAQGTLQSLNLIQCIKITDNGLKCVLQSNLGLTKLSIPGCCGLSIDGVLSTVKAFNSVAKPGLKHLGVYGIRGVANTHLEELKHLLDANNLVKQKPPKPRFYIYAPVFPACEDDRTLDIEICLKCEKPRLVYDCTAEGCQSKKQTPQRCKACDVCVKRCCICGRCIGECCEYEETFLFQLNCMDCLQKFMERLKGKNALPAKDTFIHQRTRCHHFPTYG